MRALDDVSLAFADGEFFGLLGPSGSGKTTLLRAIAGFVEPDSGDIRFDDRPVRDLAVHRREIGMVFQNYALFPHMSVFDNIAFGLSVRHLAAAEIKARVTEILGLVRLAGYEERRPRQLSGGQQQRVALARALVTKPRVLLLDEPLGALDKRLRQQMQIELRQIQREVGITTIFVTHDQEEALTLSDRIAIFNEGRVVQIGAPHAVYERPSSAFAASFLGDANFFAGRVSTAGGQIETDGGRRIATFDALPPAGARITVAVRPEKMLLEAGAASASDTPNRWSGVVQAGRLFRQQHHLPRRCRRGDRRVRPEPVGAAARARHGRGRELESLSTPSSWRRRRDSRPASVVKPEHPPCRRRHAARLRGGDGLAVPAIADVVRAHLRLGPGARAGDRLHALHDSVVDRERNRRLAALLRALAIGCARSHGYRDVRSDGAVRRLRAAGRGVRQDDLLRFCQRGFRRRRSRGGVRRR